jgi:ketopantoate reductase
MEDLRFAVVGIGATGTVLAAALLRIAEGCFKEALDVARAMGYDMANKTPTEIDFLGGKIVEYGRQKGIPTPFYVTMTNLVKAIEAGYLPEM